MARVGVAITRHNRHEVGDRCIEQWRKHTPDDMPMFIVDDASEPPVEATHRFDENVGVAAAKNMCISLLMDADVDHLFLSDDDTWPIADEWWKPYVESPIRHMTFMGGPSGYKAFEYAVDGHTYWHWPRGVLLYVTRDVIDTVGGMRLEYGKFWGEHTEWTNRIHNAGLTPHVAIDIEGSDALFETITDTLPHSVPQDVFAREVLDARALGGRFDGSTEYVEYR